MFTFRPGKNNSGQKNGGYHGNGHASAANHNGNGFNPSYRNGNGHSNGHPSAVESVIGPGIHYQGSLNGNGGIRIEGSFDGHIKLGGPLVITEGAKVTCESIEASVVSVAGTVKGNIKAEKIEILATGRIYGDLTTLAFSSEEGAFLRGQITMQDQLAPEPEGELEAA